MLLIKVVDIYTDKIYFEMKFSNISCLQDVKIYIH